MPDQPRHPDTSADAGIATGSVPHRARQRWKAALLVVVGIAALLLVIILHVTGVVGAGTNG
jgi:hypothetical protein